MNGLQQITHQSRTQQLFQNSSPSVQTVTELEIGQYQQTLNSTDVSLDDDALSFGNFKILSLN